MCEFFNRDFPKFLFVTPTRSGTNALKFIIHNTIYYIKSIANKILLFKPGMEFDNGISKSISSYRNSPRNFKDMF